MLETVNHFSIQLQSIHSSFSQSSEMHMLFCTVVYYPAVLLSQIKLAIDRNLYYACKSFVTAMHATFKHKGLNRVQALITYVYCKLLFLSIYNIILTYFQKGTNNTHGAR